MKTYQMLLVSGLIAVFFTLGCKKENLDSTITLAVNTTSSSTTTLNKVAAANNLQFTSGTITIREVVFDGETGSQSISRTIEQIADIDYATGNVSPAVVIEVPAGNYSDVNLGIEIQDINADPTVVIEGTFTDSTNTDVPVRFEFNSGEVFEAEASIVDIPAGTDLIAKITFDALDWFSVVSAAEMNGANRTNGMIIISETSNPALFDKVADRLDVATQAVFE